MYKKCVGGINKLALDLLKSFTATSTGNTFISPYSISNSLAILAMGCQGSSYCQIASALQWQTIADDEDKIFACYKRLDKKLSSTCNNKLLIANSIWSRSSVLPTFVQNVKKNFGEAFPLSSAEEINLWASQKTNKQIKELVNQISPATSVILANAIYFKGIWQKQFDSKQTKRMPFQTTNKAKQVAMLSLRATLHFAMEKDYSCVELFYADEEYSMVLVRPEGEISLNEFIRNRISQDFPEEIASKLSAGEITIKLPKFKVEYEKEIRKELEDLKITQVFVPGAAGLGRLTGDTSVYVSNFFHKAVCEVNEEGTEAAAASAVVLSRSISWMPPQQILFDRPFLFFIKSVKQNLILFIGTITDPSLHK